MLKVQQLLAMCGEHIEAEEGASWKTMHQGPAVIGMALIAMAEPLGAQMAGRSLEHMLQVWGVGVWMPVRVGMCGVCVDAGA